MYNKLFRKITVDKECCLLVGLGSPWYYEKFISEHPNASVICLEDESFRFFWRAHSTTNNVVYFCNFENTENINNTLKGIEETLGIKFDCIIMNPPYKVGGKFWDIARKHSSNVVCLMPISKYDKYSYKYIKTREKIDSSLFVDARITYDIYITTCDGKEYDNWKNYDEFLCSEYDARFTPYYEFNALHSSIKMKRKRSCRSL